MLLKIKKVRKAGLVRNKLTRSASICRKGNINNKINKKDLENHLDQTELEIDSRKIQYYGYISEY